MQHDMKKYLKQIINDDYETYIAHEKNKTQSKRDENIDFLTLLLTGCVDIDECMFIFECLNDLRFYSIDLSRFYNFDKIFVSLLEYIVKNIGEYKINSILSYIEKTIFGKQYLLENLDKVNITQHVCITIDLRMTTDINSIVRMDVSSEIMAKIFNLLYKRSGIINMDEEFVSSEELRFLLKTDFINLNDMIAQKYIDDDAEGEYDYSYSYETDCFLSFDKN